MHIRVAPHKTRPDAAGAGVIVHAGADVQRGTVEREADFGALRRELTLVGLCLAKAGRRGGGTPHPLVELAVEMDLLPQRDGADFRRGSGMNVLRY